MSDTPQCPFGATRAPNELWLSRAIPEDVLDPTMPIVDPHMHFWHHKTGYTYFVQDFARDIEESGHNIESSVFIECGAMYRNDGPEHLRALGEIEFAVGMSAMAASGRYTPVRAAAGIVSHVNLMSSRAADAIDAHLAAANGRLKGVRHRAKWDADPAVRGAVDTKGPGLLLDPELGTNLDLLASRGLVFEASVFHPQLSDVTALARAHPEAKIVVIHSGSPVGHSSYAGREREVFANWLASIKELSKCENVSMKLGGLLMTLGNYDFLASERPPTSEELAVLWGPYTEACLEHFGVDRCMAASNFPVEKAGMTYRVVWNTFKRIMANASEEDRRKIFCETAKRVYDLV